MAWTTPRTWTDGELVTASIMNTHVRDNQLAEGPHLIARKTSNQSVTSSTTVVNDSALLMSVGANETWLTRWGLLFTTASATAGLRVSWSFPTAGALEGSWSFVNTAAAYSGFGIVSGTNPTTEQAMGAQSAGSDVNYLAIELVYVGGANAGTVQLKWAQTTSNATATVMKTNSALWAVKLA